MKRSKSDKVIEEVYGVEQAQDEQAWPIDESIQEPAQETEQAWPVEEPEGAPQVKPRHRGKRASAEQPSTENVEIPKQEMVLYIITDKPITGELRYYREAGLGVSRIFTNVEEARGRLLMQSKPTRIVVVDTGTGKFMTTSIRRELIDMIGANDENNKFTVIYTDSALKSETIRDVGKMGKTIEWVEYESTAAMVAYMLQHHEIYLLEKSADKIEEEDQASALKYKGIRVEGLTEGERLVPMLSGDAITRHIFSEQEEQIPGFEVRL